MTVTQTVKIPASHRLIIDVPPEIPEGFAILTFASTGAKFPPPHDGVSTHEPPYLRLLGCHRGAPNGSVNDFHARCREDKVRELAIEERQLREHASYAQ